jgi:hypothetical protein
VTPDGSVISEVTVIEVGTQSLEKLLPEVLMRLKVGPAVSAGVDVTIVVCLPPQEAKATAQIKASVPGIGFLMFSDQTA